MTLATNTTTDAKNGLGNAKRNASTNVIVNTLGRVTEPYRDVIFLAALRCDVFET